jgi:AhpD family alkylhydroperoxidase
MARVRDIASSELPAELAGTYEEFAEAYGPFRNQVAVFAHVPAALRHLMPLLMELREAATLPKRYLELAIVAVSQVNACDYCVAHHKPFLAVEGLSASGVDRLLDYQDHPELNDVDRLVVEYAIAATERPNRLPDAIFARLRRHFTEAQLSSLHCASRCADFSTGLMTPWVSKKRKNYQRVKEKVGEGREPLLTASVSIDVPKSGLTIIKNDFRRFLSKSG